MCLPGVSVTALEKGVQQPVVCHFAIDWMSVEVRLKEKMIWLESVVHLIRVLYTYL